MTYSHLTNHRKHHPVFLIIIIMSNGDRYNFVVYYFTVRPTFTLYVKKAITYLINFLHTNISFNIFAGAADVLKLMFYRIEDNL